MPAMKVSEHVKAVMVQLDQIQVLKGEERIQAAHQLYHLFKMIQSGACIVAPLYPETDRLTDTVEKYRENLKPEDILSDDPGPFVWTV